MNIIEQRQEVEAAEEALKRLRTAFDRIEACRVPYQVAPLYLSQLGVYLLKCLDALVATAKEHIEHEALR